MAGQTGTQRRRLVASSIAIILAAATLTPATTDARGGGGFGGHGGTMSGGHAHFGAAGAFQNTGPAIPGPATVRRFPFSSRHAVSSHMSFSHSSHHIALHHTHAIGSHFATLGYDGIWLDNYVFAPTVVIAQQAGAAPPQQAAHSRAPAVRTPSASEQGVILVRGDSKSYVTFPSSKRG